MLEADPEVPAGSEEEDSGRTETNKMKKEGMYGK